MTAALVAAAAALLVVWVRPRQPVIDRYLVTEPTRTTRHERPIRVPASVMVGGALGIEDDGWEEVRDLTDPETALLMYLGYLQDTLVRVLT